MTIIVGEWIVSCFHRHRLNGQISVFFFLLLLLLHFVSLEIESRCGLENKFRSMLTLTFAVFVTNRGKSILTIDPHHMFVNDNQKIRLINSIISQQ